MNLQGSELATRTEGVVPHVVASLMAEGGGPGKEVESTAAET